MTFHLKRVRKTFPYLCYVNAFTRFETLSSVIIKASKIVIALKQISVPCAKQAPANFKKSILHHSKETHRANGSRELQRKSDQILFLKLSAIAAIRDQSCGSKTRQLSE